MNGKQLLTAAEAVLLFTELKIKIASRFREGIEYKDFLEFEEQLDLIDRSLARAAHRIGKKLYEFGDDGFEEEIAG
jgi:hypothetical protein